MGTELVTFNGDSFKIGHWYYVYVDGCSWSRVLCKLVWGCSSELRFVDSRYDILHFYSSETFSCSFVFEEV